MSPKLMLTTAAAAFLAIGPTLAQTSDVQTQGATQQQAAQQQDPQGQQFAEQLQQAEQQLHEAQQIVEQNPQQARQQASQALVQLDETLQNPPPAAREAVAQARPMIEDAREELGKPDLQPDRVLVIVREITSLLQPIRVSVVGDGQQPTTKVDVAQQPAEITVQQPAPEVVVEQQPPQVTVVQPEPQVTIQQPEPDVTVQQAEPQVTVDQTGQPEVQVQQQGQAEVTVKQAEEAEVQAEQQTDAAGQQTEEQVAGLSAVDAEKLIGKQAYGSNGENVGEIRNVLIGPNGQVRAAVIEFGGFLGIASNEVAVDMSKLQVGEDRVVVSMTEDEIKSAPKFDREQVAEQYGPEVELVQ